VIQETSTTVVLNNNVVSPGVGSSDTITFTGNDLTWFDSNGMTIGGQRNAFIPAGQGIVSFDSSGTATYSMSFNSHANNSLDMQTCNNLGITCSSLGAVPAFRIFTSASGAGQPIFQINYDSTITLQFANGTASSTKAVCMDSSNRLVKSTTGACP
jgi:hypothetical protein